MAIPSPLFAALFALEPSLPLPLTRLTEVSWFSALLEYPPIKALTPVPILIALYPPARFFFKNYWQELDAEANRARLELPPSEYDYRRPLACLGIVEARRACLQRRLDPSQCLTAETKTDHRPIGAGVQQRRDRPRLRVKLHQQADENVGQFLRPR